ncbi:MAG: RnfABCDGE type electron transport complex subunit D [Treponema sp.]|nr:RnfABCDGE type electron transport complex subunit D [Treponema sp.]
MKSKQRLYASVFLSPFSYLRPSVRTESYVIFGLLLLQVLMLFLTKSYSSLVLVLVALCAALLAEFLGNHLVEKAEKRWQNPFVWVSGMIRGILIALLLPASFPPFAVFFITFWVLYINSRILGGFANSWINPIAVVVAICWIIGMKFFPEISLTMTELQSRNPALLLIQNGTFPVESFDVGVTSFLNKKVFSLLGVSIPDGYVSLFWDSHSSIPAFRFNLLTILSSIVLLGMDMLNPIIPLSFIAVYLLLVRFCAPIFYGGPLFQGDVLLALLSSGTLFCTFFLLHWHGTTPFTNRGKYFYGIFAGILAFFIMGAGMSPAGFAFTILISNIVSLLIQSFENHISQKFTDSVLAENVASVREGTNA